MSPGRNDRAEEIYRAALELAPSRRRTFMIEACGLDSELRREVESRLSLAHASDPPQAPHPDPVIEGRVISHYEVAGRIGAGGMGTVYRARDLRLKRQVALKFLHSNLLQSEDARQRFLREGQALSALNHPNIATVYEVDESDGLLFLALEYLSGGTLRDRIRAAAKSGNQLALQRLLDWAIDVAEAVSHAHRRGVLHRDIKSSNIMFDGDERVKLTDFGLARMLEDPEHSAPGTVIGTLSYMAPEQAEGKNTDPRSDLYSLGVVLYEAATGRLPFKGSSPAEVLHKVMHTLPAPPSSLREDLPSEFDEIVGRLLSKKPEDRFRRPEEVTRSLQGLRRSVAGTDSFVSTKTLTTHLPPKLGRRWVLAAGVAAGLAAVALGVFGPGWPGTAEPVRKLVAVLPFRNIGGDPAQQAFADGLTETLTTALTRQPELSVVASMDAGKLATAAQARREFGVNLVVTGSAQRRGDELRLVIEVIDAEAQREIDRQPIDWPVADIAKLEDGVLTKVADLLSVVITQEQRTLLASSASPIAGAHDAYLRGRGFLYRYDVAGNLQKARDAFEEATRQDPDFAAAYVGLAETLWRLYRDRRDPAQLAAARAAGLQAVQFNQRLAGAHTALGTVLAESRQLREAEQEFETARKLDPLDPAVYRELAALYQSQRRFRDAERVLLDAIAIRPGDWISHNEIGVFYRSQQKYADAERSYRRVVELAPDNYIGYRNWGVALVSLGRNRDAEEAFRKALDLRPAASVYNNLGALFMFEKRYADAVPMMEKATELAPTEMANSFRVWGNLGDAYWLAKLDLQKARDAWLHAAQMVEQQLVGSEADAENLSLLAKYRAKLGERREAIRRIENAIQYAPGSAVVRYQAGLTYSLLGEKERAIAELRLAVARGYSASEIQAAPESQPLRTDPLFASLFH
jgi:serine/threonine-protein kinase